jgi:hypothetical protein
MDILRMMGISHELRAQKEAINGNLKYDSKFYTSRSASEELITTWVSLQDQIQDRSSP